MIDEFVGRLALCFGPTAYGRVTKVYDLLTMDSQDERTQLYGVTEMVIHISAENRPTWAEVTSLVCSTCDRHGLPAGCKPHTDGYGSPVTETLPYLIDEVLVE